MDAVHNDRLLATRIAQGDEAAFTVLYQQYENAIRRFVITYLKSPALAEDVSQEIFLKLWEGRDALENINSIKAYLFTIARNHTINVLKKASTHTVAIGEIIKSYETSRNYTEDDVLSHDYSQFLTEVLESLPPRAREVFRLCREQQRSYQEVAAILGISRNAVKGHMVHSMKILRNAVHKKLGLSLVVFLAILASGKN